MTRYIWDKEEKRYKERGFDYYFSLVSLISLGVIIYGFCTCLLIYVGMPIGLYIGGLVFWTFLYLWFWDLFKRDFK